MSENAENKLLIKDKFDFSSVIAVAIHDMKNSLSLLMQSIEQLSDTIPQNSEDARNKVNSVHYEASRMNTTLVQILSLYRSEIDALPINIDECFINDLLEEVVASNLIYTKQKDLTINVQVDEDLNWYLDKELTYLLIHDVLINAIRYGGNYISLSAYVEDEQLHIIVKDDGNGYPKEMLDMSKVNLDNFCISEGRTGLGLYFARLIAQTHRNADKRGFIKLSNDDSTGGSIFELVLP